MLTALAFATIAVLLVLLLSNRVSAVVALISVPLAAAALAGFGPGEITGFVSAGVGGVVGTVAMFVFAILFFGVMRDAGLFDPVVERVLRFAGRDPVTISVATVVLAMACHLDGAGATTFLITVPAMLPLYEALGMRRLQLAALAGLGAGVMNLVPWGGPTARAATTVGTGANDLWAPLIPAQAVGIVAAIAVAYLLGRRERRRLAAATQAAEATEATEATGAGPGGADAGGPRHTASEHARPRLFWANVAVTTAVVGVLIWGVLSPELVFMIGLVVALVVNYPGMRAQTERINAHAQGAVLMASTLLAAGVFLGVMEESGMIEAMASSLTGAVPQAAGPALPLVVGALGVPMSLLFGPDAYYFAVLPVLNAVGAGFGADPDALARASLVGQETVGFPISPLTGSFFLLTGLARVPIGAHIRFLLPWAWLVSLIMLAAAVLTGAVPAWTG